MLELTIVIIVVVAAAVFVAMRWVRSAKRVLAPPPGALPGCGGTCEGCTVKPADMPATKEACAVSTETKTGRIA